MARRKPFAIMVHCDVETIHNSFLLLWQKPAVSSNSVQNEVTLVQLLPIYRVVKFSFATAEKGASSAGRGEVRVFIAPPEYDAMQA